MNKTKDICYLIGSASIRVFNLHAGKKEDSKKNNWRHLNYTIGGTLIQLFITCVILIKTNKVNRVVSNIFSFRKTQHQSLCKICTDLIETNEIKKYPY